MNALHLLWIVPLSFFLGYVTCALLAVNGKERMTRECEHEGITIKPDGIHELSPHYFKKVQVFKNVTVEILQCKKCGEVSIGWYRQENTEEVD